MSSVCLKTLLQEGLSEPELYDGIAYKARKILGLWNKSYRNEKLHFSNKTEDYLELQTPLTWMLRVNWMGDKNNIFECT